MLMTPEKQALLATIDVSPYVALATILICKERKTAGNQFRHQVETQAILIDYGYVDAVLHKAALVHDLIEDIDGFDAGLMIHADADGEAVYRLVLEVSRRWGEDKAAFLTRILEGGSLNARRLKCADRISNMHDLGIVSGSAFIERYCDETERYILPMAEAVDADMAKELRDLIKSRRGILEMLRRLPD